MKVERSRLERALNPRSVAVVGDKAPNYQWLSNLSEFRGPKYCVQLNTSDVAGIEAKGGQHFTSLLDIPGEIDLVVCAVPRQAAPQIAADAAAKGVGGLAMYTSGFEETAEELGISLQRRVEEICSAAGLPLIGPNCMGVYNRRLGVKFNAVQEAGEGGEVSIISQSGTHASGLAAGCQRLGVRVSRGISIGNAALLNESDFLEYLVDDEATPAVVMYLEGVKEGRRFFDALQRISRLKPVVVLRGGRASAGARAVASHTASLASDDSIWRAMLDQAGAISVDSIEDAADTVAALVHLPRSTSRSLALIAMTGGQSVAITDQFERAGFDVPELSEASYQALGEFFITIGGSYRNPLDASNTIGRETDNLQRILDILGADPHVAGGVAIELRSRGIEEGVERIDAQLEAIRTYQGATGRPVVALMPDGAAMGPMHQALIAAREHVGRSGVAVFPSFERGARAFARAVDYWRWREDIESEDGAITASGVRRALV